MKSIGIARAMSLASAGYVILIVFTISLTWTGSAWGQCKFTEFLASDGEIGDSFGGKVVLSSDGQTAFVSSIGDNDAGTSAGAVYVFVNQDGKWIEQSKLIGSAVHQYDFFGLSLATAQMGNLLLVGALGDSVNGSSSGSAYIFTREGTTWTEQQRLIPADGNTGDKFGLSASLSADGQTALIGTFRPKAYIYENSKSGWQETAQLIRPEDQAGFFARSVALNADGTTAVLGSPTFSGGGHTQLANVFVENELGWNLQATFSDPDKIPSGLYGAWVDISDNGNTVIIGDRSKAHIYIRNGDDWSNEAELEPFGPGDFGYGGISVALSGDGDTAIIGDKSATEIYFIEGAAFIFKRTESQWAGVSKLRQSNPAVYDLFGASVAVSADAGTALVGSIRIFDAFWSLGSAYVFTLVGDDTDNDGVIDLCDNCPDHTNPDQNDCDNDGLGDVCTIADGLSMDCNANGVPDDCELNIETEMVYVVDDGFWENNIGLSNGGDIIWLNQFTVAKGSEVIVAMDLAWGNVAEGTLIDLAIWSDPNNDGDPDDAVLLMLADPVPVINSNSNLFTTYNVPPTYVGNPGTSFFIGAHITFQQGEHPIPLDSSPPSQGQSWITVGDNMEDLNENFYLMNTDESNFPGNWLIRGRREIIPDCNSNGVLDECDIADKTSQDVNNNGIPDECESQTCPWDIDNSGSVGVGDLLMMFAQWGTPGSADFNNDGIVNTSDLLILLANWGACP